MRPNSAVLDIGTGSGAIAIAIAANAQERESSRPIYLKNHLKLRGGTQSPSMWRSRSNFATAISFPMTASRFDLIVSNPPYVADADLEALAPEIRLHEPRLALTGGPDGLDFYRRIATGMPIAPQSRRGGDGRDRRRAGREVELFSAQPDSATLMRYGSGRHRAGGLRARSCNESMDKMIIHGGAPLRGAVSVSGSKNATLPILMASLLTDEPVPIRNVPHLRDVRTALALLRAPRRAIAAGPAITTLVASRREASPRTRRPTIWSRPCARRSWCSGRCSRAPDGPRSRRPADARSARGR